ncbi:acetoacetyl-CoA synthetase [Caerostris extrusa]|uniref:Acetoacetyl-CoA synthetase n=1 Tax=Caerostris extrusa TaxID=172846 RepID=A0AAV4Y376_CAEEX|nr:acetoacetyl-CoA synthetase [Caerostris extrusa]
MIPEDGEWGRLKEDGNWTGIIGLVHSNKADVAIGHLTITPSRQRISGQRIAYKSLDESLQIIGEHITEEDWLTGGSGNKIVVAPSKFDDFTAVLGPRFFFLLEYGQEPYATKRIFKETISFWNVGLAVRKQFCCKEELIKYIARILNNGILEKLYGDELFKTKLKFNWKEFEKSKNDALSIRHLFGAFILLGAGVAKLLSARATLTPFIPKGEVQTNPSYQHAAFPNFRKERGLSSVQFLETFDHVLWRCLCGGNVSKIKIARVNLIGEMDHLRLRTMGCSAD